MHESTRSLKSQRVKSVQALEGYRLAVTFNDGLEGIVDLSDALNGPAFEPLRKPEFFRQVFVSNGVVAWPNDVDLDPYALYRRVAAERTPATIS